MSEPTRLADAIEGFLAEKATQPERHPLIRSGERDPIPNLVRLSIYLRDDHRCRRCNLPNANLELDHIKPWSAGGSDASTNLRTLCQPCNQSRSNYRDPTESRAAIATTWWCFHCWRHPEVEVDDPDGGDWSRSMLPFRVVWKDGTNPSAVPFVVEPSMRVYCATCQTHSVSDIAFTEPQQARLVALCTPADPSAREESA